MGRLIDADNLMKDIIRRFGCKPYIEVGNKYEYFAFSWCKMKIVYFNKRRRYEYGL